LLHNNVNVEALQEKLDKIEIPEWRQLPVALVLTPMKQLRYKDPTGDFLADIKFNHIRIFGLAGLLVVLCSLFNHLTLFVTRVRMRLRELALRKVNGASDWQVATTLYTDFLLVIMLSLVAGLMMMTSLLPTFKEYADIGSTNVRIFGELTIYAALLIVFGFFAGGIPVLYFRRQVLNECIKGSGNPGSKNLFRKCSLLVQLIISLGMMFCAAVFIKQMRYLHQQPDLLVNRSNVAFVRALSVRPVRPHWIDQFKQIPGIIDAIPSMGTWNFVNNIFGMSTVNFIDSMGNPASALIHTKREDPRFFEFFGIDVVQGNVYPKERREFVAGENNINTSWFVLNEAAMREAGDLSRSPYFMGVVRDIYITPTANPMPIRFHYPPMGATDAATDMNYFYTVIYKYEEGMRQQTHEAVIQWYRNEFPDRGDFVIEFDYTEDLYNVHFKSERALLTLLSIMTLACILIAVFGVYSLTSLTCQQRRKEIAIRKVHGAEIVDIMNIFFKEYLILLAMAAAVAFPAGYLIMKRWLENYVKQTTIDAWLYMLTFLIVFVVIVFSIFTMVLRAANRNPAEVVKSE
jgi:ABC-type antimicrobial peptide transport system permease subunit